MTPNGIAIVGAYYFYKYGRNSIWVSAFINVNGIYIVIDKVLRNFYRENVNLDTISRAVSDQDQKMEKQFRLIAENINSYYQAYGILGMLTIPLKTIFQLQLCNSEFDFLKIVFCILFFF